MTSLKWPFSWALDHVKFDEMKGRFTFASRHDGVSKLEAVENSTSVKTHTHNSCLFPSSNGIIIISHSRYDNINIYQSPFSHEGKRWE